MLTGRQARFVAEYLVDGNGARAAVAAGYGRAGAKVTAHRLTHANRAVQAEIQARQAVDSQRLQIDRQGVIQGLLEAIQIGRERQEPMAMIAGWRELAKLMGFYQPTAISVEVSASRGLGRIEAMSDAELMAVLAG